MAGLGCQMMKSRRLRSNAGSSGRLHGNETQMTQKNDFHKGQRVQINDAGLAAGFRRRSSRTGTVAAEPQRGRSVSVRWDGNKSAEIFGVGFLETLQLACRKCGAVDNSGQTPRTASVSCKHHWQPAPHLRPTATGQMVSKGAPAPAEPMYYIQAPGYSGNAVFWWAPDGAGYTSDIRLAGKFDSAFALGVLRNKRQGETAWPVEYVDGLQGPAKKLIVDSQYLQPVAALRPE